MRLPRALLVLAVTLAIALSSCTSAPEIATPTPSPGPTSTPAPTAAPPAAQYAYRIVNTFPHDPEAFTQGLVCEDGVFYEGTGLRGRSSLRKVAIETGEVLQRRDLSPEYFGEGITIYKDKIFQLTWQSKTGFIYERETFDLLGEFTYEGEGWGLTHDGTNLIMSDGTSSIRFLDPETLQVVRQIEVKDGQNPVTRLNELEYINGEIYANVWQTDRIARISPDTGRVAGWIDLAGILDAVPHESSVDVLNGIAYDSVGNRLFVTGKLWPVVFEVELVPR